MMSSLDPCEECQTRIHLHLDKMSWSWCHIANALGELMNGFEPGTLIREQLE